EPRVRHQDDHAGICERCDADCGDPVRHANPERMTRHFRVVGVTVVPLYPDVLFSATLDASMLHPPTRPALPVRTIETVPRMNPKLPDVDGATIRQVKSY